MHVGRARVRPAGQRARRVRAAAPARRGQRAGPAAWRGRAGRQQQISSVCSEYGGVATHRTSKRRRRSSPAPSGQRCSRWQDSAGGPGEPWPIVFRFSPRRRCSHGGARSMMPASRSTLLVWQISFWILWNVIQIFDVLCSHKKNQGRILKGKSIFLSSFDTITCCLWSRSKPGLQF